MARTATQDPYRNFRFRLFFDNNPVAGLKKMSALTKSTEPIDWREAGDNNTTRKLPGKTKYEPVTLEAGVTADTEFETWADAVNKFDSDNLMSADEFRRDIRLEVYDMQNNKVLTYVIYDAWVSKYTAVPDMDASSNEVAIQTLELQNEGWKRL
jgi:phage tail-like protein